MSANTPIYALTYPTSGDPLANVRGAMQELATDVESTLAALFAGGVPGAGYTAFPYAANWGNPGAPFQNGRYMKYGNTVVLEMYPIRSVSASGALSTIGQLPVGYRPINTYNFPVVNNAGGTLTLNNVEVRGTTTATPGFVVLTNTVAVGTAIAGLHRIQFPIN